MRDDFARAATRHEEAAVPASCRPACWLLGRTRDSCDHLHHENCRIAPIPVPLESLANAVPGELFGRRVMIASIDDLLAMKRAANRPKDRLDIEALEKIQRGEDANA